jgi:hypothetical protein
MPRVYSFNDFIKEIYGKHQSIFTCVLGSNETGKTDFNLLQMERIHDLGVASHFGTNMRSVQADFEITFIEDFETLKKTCKMLNPDAKKYGLKKFFFFGSEIGKWAARDRAWENTDLIKELQTVRKYGLSMLTDAIDRVDARVLSKRFFRGEYEKPYKDNKKFAIFRDYTNDRVYQFKDIPKTRIDYDTYETANLFMKPQVPEDAIVPMNKEHEVVKRYMEFGSWKKAGVHPQEGKRDLFKVLDYHYKNCLLFIHEEPQQIEESSTASAE